ncbi:hypothetical protein PanWU01x14_227030 [Parasponia andersonii]|uniref:Uncharacterized protein n=1 Tax=Parasponia andersonii TaxID=3476 RepID=A0A2P5BM65_PARAD|nr:hypothetical protein PanWU01x14_227030 [Parasponia andersonii]
MLNTTLHAYYPPQLVPFHVGTSSASLIVDAYADTYNASDPIPPLRPTYYPRKVKFGAPEFDGSLDPSAFLHWLDQKNEYFDWYSMTEAQRISMARIKLVGDAKSSFSSLATNSKPSIGSIPSAPSPASDKNASQVSSSSRLSTT